MVRQVLIAAQVTASCVLLIVAGLLVRATLHMLYTDPGFAYEQLLSVDAQLAQHSYSPAAAQAYLDTMQERIRALPGVKSVSLVKLPPTGHTVSRMDEDITGHRVTRLLVRVLVPDSTGLETHNAPHSAPIAHIHARVAIAARQLAFGCGAAHFRPRRHQRRRTIEAHLAV